MTCLCCVSADAPAGRLCDRCQLYFEELSRWKPHPSARLREYDGMYGADDSFFERGEFHDPQRMRRMPQDRRVTAVTRKRHHRPDVDLSEWQLNLAMRQA